MSFFFDKQSIRYLVGILVNRPQEKASGITPHKPSDFFFNGLNTSVALKESGKGRCKIFSGGNPL